MTERPPTGARPVPPSPAFLDPDREKTSPVLLNPQNIAALVVATAVLLQTYDPGIARRRYAQVYVYWLMPAAAGVLLLHPWVRGWWSWPAGALAAALAFGAITAVRRRRRRSAHADA